MEPMAEFFVSMAALADYFAGEPWGLSGGDGGAEAGPDELETIKAGTAVPCEG